MDVNNSAEGKNLMGEGAAERREGNTAEKKETAVRVHGILQKVRFCMKNEGNLAKSLDKKGEMYYNEMK